MAFAGPVVFATIVVTLQVLNSEYDPAERLMSTLALGPRGEWMPPAFCGFALGILGARQLLAKRASKPVASWSLACAALAIAGAGFVTLNDSIAVHISLIALGFVLLTVAMLFVEPAHGRRLMLVSRGLAVLTAASVASPQLGAPLGIAQRIAAGTVLVWIVLVATATLREARWS